MERIEEIKEEIKNKYVFKFDKDVKIIECEERNIAEIYEGERENIIEQKNEEQIVWDLTEEQIDKIDIAVKKINKDNECEVLDNECIIVFNSVKHTFAIDTNTSYARETGEIHDYTTVELRINEYEFEEKNKELCELLKEVLGGSFQLIRFEHSNDDEGETKIYNYGDYFFIVENDIITDIIYSVVEEYDY